MDRRLKAAAASCVLLIGVTAALLFRHESPPAAQRGAPPDDRLLLREGAYPPAQIDRSGRRTDAYGRPLPATAVAVRPPTVLTPGGPSQPPPELAKDYPHFGIEARPHWGTSIGLGPSPGTGLPQAEPQIHRVVDGDTLQTLAEQYLGSPDRATEIYEANRDRLISPTILPIGVRLKIPPPDAGTRGKE